MLSGYSRPQARGHARAFEPSVQAIRTGQARPTLAMIARRSAAFRPGTALIRYRDASGNWKAFYYRIPEGASAEDTARRFRDIADLIGQEGSPTLGGFRFQSIEYRSPKSGTHVYSLTNLRAGQFAPAPGYYPSKR